ncbi:MAG TPA: hypothetical protein VJ843_01795 [Candidatus Saccharimonadales bacterium]|nr:hypothetical protein [Candidatus Saccharimonadales bacterium]
MSQLGDRLIAEARSHIGAPFRHHFRPENLCAGGTITLDQCMEQGVDPTGYDCSGLVVASMCRVLGLQPGAWPRHLRHSVQLQQHATEKIFAPGDIQFYYYENGGVHSSIATTSPDVSVYASGRTRLVEEGFAADGAPPIGMRSVAADVLCDIVRAELLLSPEYQVE